MRVVDTVKMSKYINAFINLLQKLVFLFLFLSLSILEVATV